MSLQVDHETRIPSWAAIGLSAAGGALFTIVATFTFGDKHIWWTRDEGASLSTKVVETATRLSDVAAIIERVNTEQARRTGILAEIQTNQIAMLSALKSIQDRALLSSDSLIQLQTNVNYLNESLKDLKAEMKSEREKK